VVCWAGLPFPGFADIRFSVRRSGNQVGKNNTVLLVIFIRVHPGDTLFCSDPILVEYLRSGPSSTWVVK
jgi:hypothetical protein